MNFKNFKKIILFTLLLGISTPTHAFWGQETLTGWWNTTTSSIANVFRSPSENQGVIVGTVASVVALVAGVFAFKWLNNDESKENLPSAQSSIDSQGDLYRAELVNPDTKTGSVLAAAHQEGSIIEIKGQSYQLIDPKQYFTNKDQELDDGSGLGPFLPEGSESEDEETTQQGNITQPVSLLGVENQELTSSDETMSASLSPHQLELFMLLSKQELPEWDEVEPLFIGQQEGVKKNFILGLLDQKDEGFQKNFKQELNDLGLDALIAKAKELYQKKQIEQYNEDEADLQVYLSDEEKPCPQASIELKGEQIRLSFEEHPLLASNHDSFVRFGDKKFKIGVSSPIGIEIDPIVTNVKEIEEMTEDDFLVIEKMEKEITANFNKKRERDDVLKSSIKSPGDLARLKQISEEKGIHVEGFCDAEYEEHGKIIRYSENGTIILYTIHGTWSNKAAFGGRINTISTYNIFKFASQLAHAKKMRVKVVSVSWSGALDVNDRYEKARHLADHCVSLWNNEAAHIKETWMLGHSHGCNIASMAANYIFDETNKLVDEGILMACPALDILPDHDRARCPDFKKVNAFWAHGDFTQVAGSAYDRHNFDRKVPWATPGSGRKVYNIRVMFNGFDMDHVSIKWGVVPHLAKILASLDTQYPQHYDLEMNVKDDAQSFPLISIRGIDGYSCAGEDAAAVKLSDNNRSIFEREYSRDMSALGIKSISGLTWLMNLGREGHSAWQGEPTVDAQYLTEVLHLPSLIVPQKAYAYTLSSSSSSQQKIHPEPVEGSSSSMLVPVRRTVLLPAWLDLLSNPSPKIEVIKVRLARLNFTQEQQQKALFGALIHGVLAQNLTNDLSRLEELVDKEKIEDALRWFRAAREKLAPASKGKGKAFTSRTVLAPRIGDNLSTDDLKQRVVIKPLQDVPIDLSIGTIKYACQQIYQQQQLLH